METVQSLINKLKKLPKNSKVAIVDLSIDNDNAVFSKFAIDVVEGGINEDTDQAYPEWVAIVFDHRRGFENTEETEEETLNRVKEAVSKNYNIKDLYELDTEEDRIIEKYNILQSMFRDVAFMYHKERSK